MKLWLYICFLCVFAGVNSWRKFERGRKSTGNIGEPKSQKTQLKDIPTQWYFQNLDHFNPTDERTWKQVIAFDFNFCLII